MYLKNCFKKLSQLVSSQSAYSRASSCRHFQYSTNLISFRNNQAISQPSRASFPHLQVRSKGTKSRLDHSRVPKLDENDLVEQFVRGSGPGGQATAKTCNAVVLKHKPTGIVVKCHETRSMWDNKKRAREILVTRLDNMINGEHSLEAQERALLAKKAANRARKRDKMLTLKAAFKEREGIE